MTRSHRATSTVEVYIEIEPEGRKKPGFILDTYGSKYHDRLSQYFSTWSYLTIEPEIEWQFVPADPEVGQFNPYYEAVNVKSLGQVDCTYKIFDGVNEHTIEEKDLPQDIAEILKDICVGYVTDQEIEGPSVHRDDYDHDHDDPRD